MELKKLKTIRSHQGFADYLANCEDAIRGYIPKQEDIPSPYAYSPTHTVFNLKKGTDLIPVFWVEVKHRTYNVYQVINTLDIYADEDAAADAYLAKKD